MADTVSPISKVGIETPAMMLSRLQAALRQFQSSGHAFKLVDTGSTSTSATPTPTPRKCRTLVILDSSFNPPTVAHMTMATSAVRDLQAQRNIALTLTGGGGTKHGVDDDGIRLLLLLAINNADKAPKPASFEHRLLMMRAFAKDVQQAWRRAQTQRHDEQQQSSSSLSSLGDELPVDIGLTTYPYFHDKSAAIARAAEYEFTISSPSAPTTQQVFLAGYDTLIRIFNPKYYSPPVPEEVVIPQGEDKAHGDKTPIQVSLDPFLARATLRVTMRTDADWGGRDEQMGYVEKILHGEELEKIGGRREWAQRVEMVEAMEDKDGLVLSSTEAREAIQAKSWNKVRRLVPESVAELIEQGEVHW